MKMLSEQHVDANTNRRASDVPWDHDPNGHLPLVLEQFAMENGPFIFDLPIKMEMFSCFFIASVSYCHFNRRIYHIHQGIETSIYFFLFSKGSRFLLRSRSRFWCPWRR